MSLNGAVFLVLTFFKNLVAFCYFYVIELVDSLLLQTMSINRIIIQLLNTFLTIFTTIFMAVLNSPHIIASGYPKFRLPYQKRRKT